MAELPSSTAVDPLSQYREKLALLPAPGEGCNPKELGVACWAVRAGLSELQFLTDMRRVIEGRRSARPGCRQVEDAEIRKAYAKARRSYEIGLGDPSVGDCPDPPTALTDHETLQMIVQAGRHASEEGIGEQSPIPIDWPPEWGAQRVLQYLWEPDELLWCGQSNGKGIPGVTLRTREEWISHFKAGNPVPPHLIPNPMIGEEGPKKEAEGTTRRGDSTVGRYKYAVVEFDTIPWGDQIAFWWAVKLPVAALVDSGGKSTHGWVRVDCVDAEAWERDVRRALFQARLIPLGVDGNCRNESRLSRLPGHKRETGRWQRLLYLAPEGRPVHV